MVLPFKTTEECFHVKTFDLQDEIVTFFGSKGDK